MRRRDGRGFVRVEGAREHNLKNVSVALPRDALVVFTGVSGSGKSSLAFGTLYAEAQRRYLESVAPYARRLFHQIGAPDVDEIEGLPPAVALQQHRGAPTARSSVGSVTTLSNLVRMLYSRAGTYPRGGQPLEAEAFSPNTPAGACPRCHGLGRIYDVTECSLVPDDSLSIRERAVAAWPPAWHGGNLRDMLISLGHDVDRPWRELPRKTRDWILFTDEQPVVPVYDAWDAAEARRARTRNAEPLYRGNFSSARRYVLTTFATTDNAAIKKRVARYLVNSECPECAGKRLKRGALSVTFEGRDIAQLSHLPLRRLGELFAPYARGEAPALSRMARAHPEQAIVARRLAEDLCARLEVLLDLGLGYLALERATPTLSPGELQRLRLATQVRSNLFGVVYVLDEPSAGLHPVDTEALLRALDRLKTAGNSLFVIEHELDVVRHADWVVDVGPGAGERGGEILYSGTLPGLARVATSETGRHLFRGGNGSSGRRAAPDPRSSRAHRAPRAPQGWLCLTGVERNNLHGLGVALPLGVLCAVTGVSGSGKSSLVSQALVDLLAAKLGHAPAPDDEETPEEALGRAPDTPSGGRIASGAEHVVRLVRVDQRPIGRTPRSNLATYTGLFDHVRRAFAATAAARARRYDAGHFSFNLPKGRCATCAGEGSVMVELLFLPSVYAPCPTCHGARYDSRTLAVKLRGHSIADVLRLSVDDAATFFADAPAVCRALDVLRQVGLGYLRLGQPATELSGGEAQRIKLATELQRAQRAGTVYVLDEPTTGLHPSDVERLLGQMNELVDGGSTVIVAEHDMALVAHCDWVVDVGPGAGEEGGRIVASGPPDVVARSAASRTAPFLARALSAVAGTTRGRVGAPRGRGRRDAAPRAGHRRDAAPLVGRRRAR